MESQSFAGNRSDPILRDLTFLKVVARHSSFVSAAAELGISTALVSKRIAALEARLGVRLFNRTTRQVKITSQGEAIVARAQNILAEIDALMERPDPQGALSGILRISTSQRFGRVHMGPALAELRILHPGLDIWVELLDRRADLIGESFDIDIRMDDIQEQHLIAHRIVSNSRIVCASPGYVAQHGAPQKPSDLAQHPCLVFRERSQHFGVWRLESAQSHETVKVTGPMASNNSDIVVDWAVAGFGLMMAAAWDVGPLVASGQLVRVLPDYQQRADIIAATTARAVESQKVRLCLEFLRERFNQGPFALVQ
jgi:LysR family transcriptional activator of dmlA